MEKVGMVLLKGGGNVRAIRDVAVARVGNVQTSETTHRQVVLRLLPKTVSIDVTIANDRDFSYTEKTTQQQCSRIYKADPYCK